MIVRWVYIALFCCVLLVPGNAVAQSANLGGPNSQQQFQQNPLQPSFGLGASGSSGALVGQGSSFGSGRSNLNRGRQSGLSSGLGMRGTGTMNRGFDQGGFLGTDSRVMQDSFQNMTGRNRRRAMFDFAVESLNEMRDARRERDRRREEPSPVRVRIRPTYLPSPPASMSSSEPASQLLAGLPGSDGAAPQVTVQSKQATLQGTVETDYDRRLAEKMLMLQPGIDSVDNQLTVDSASEPLPSGGSSVGP